MELTLMYISRFSVLIPLYFLFKRRINSANNNILKGLGLLLFAAAFFDLISYLLFKMGNSNIMVDNVYTLVEFFLFSYLYSTLLKNKRPIYWGLVLFIGFLILNTWMIGSFAEFQNWPLVLEDVILFTFAIMGLLEMNKTPPEEERLASMVIWIHLTVMFYFGMNLYLFGIFDFILNNESDDIAIISWSFHNVCNIVKNLFFALAIYNVGKERLVSAKLKQA